MECKCKCSPEVVELYKTTMRSEFLLYDSEILSYEKYFYSVKIFVLHPPVLHPHHGDTNLNPLLEDLEKIGWRVKSSEEVFRQRAYRPMFCITIDKKLDEVSA